MLLGIDHVVVAVRSVEAAEAELSRAVGLAFTGGGRHEAMGTYNRLAFLGDTFVELIGVFDRGLVEAAGGSFPVGRRPTRSSRPGGEGLVTFAVASDDVAGDVALLRGPGLADRRAARGLTDTPGRRGRPVVDRVPAGPRPGAAAVPHRARARRAPSGVHAARAARAAFRHPGGGRVRLATLELPVRDAEAVADRYAKELGIAFSEGWRAAIGDQSIELVPDGSEPVVELAVEPGTPAIDALHLGIRWRRVVQPVA